jgi:hypothetical protein
MTWMATSSPAAVQSISRRATAKACAGLNEGSTLGLGVGNDLGPRRVATLHVFALQTAVGAPCGFQVQGTLWVSS